jgi:hypothetical protein
VTTDKEETITLRDACDRWRRETGLANAYDWYRRQAQEGRKVFESTYGVRGSAKKVGGAWVISVEELDSAIRAHRSEKEKIARVTADYKRHILHGKPGESVRTNWGWYTIHEALHMTGLSSPDPKWNGMESWYCSICWNPAATEHSTPECHTCRDWGGCGRDCTFSRAYCPKCGTSYPPGSGSLRAEA